MSTITNVIKSPIKGRTGTLNRSSGYEYRDFWYTDASGQRIHVVGWHRAIDITTLGTVVAIERGKVLSVQKGISGQTTSPSGGNSVLLEHGNGSRSLYCHLDNGSNNHINIGQIVEQGEELGTDTIKTTGNSTGLHLHFGIYVDGEYIDPTTYLQGIKSLQPYIINTPKPSEIIHVVVSGDTLWAIAKRYLGDGNRYPEIVKYNNIANPNVIFNGQKIKIPNCNVSEPTINRYVVKKGDTLSSIAKRYGTTWQQLYEKNKRTIGSNPNLIKPGQELIV